MMRDEDGGHQFQNIILQIGLQFVDEEFRFIRECRRWAIIDFLVKTSIIKLCIGFLYIIILVHEKNTSPFISWLHHNGIVTFQVI